MSPIRASALRAPAARAAPSLHQADPRNEYAGQNGTVP